MDAALVSLDSSGNHRWTFDRIGWMAPIPNTGFTPALASDGTVYVCGRYSLFAVNPNCTMKWKYDFPLIDNVNSAGVRQTTGSQRSAPTIAKDGTIYVNTQRGRHEGQGEVEGGVYAFDPDGTLKWRTYDVGGTAAPVIGADGTIYSAVGRYGDAADSIDLARATQDAQVLAIRPDGSLEWSVTTSLWIEASPSIGADGTLYVGTTHHPLDKPGWFYAISPDGQVKWKYDTFEDVQGDSASRRYPPDIYNSPAIGSDGLIYFGNEAGLLYAMRPDGKTEWIDHVPSQKCGSPALSDDGTLYVGGDTKVDLDHYGMLALNTGSRGLAASPWPKFRRNNANTGDAGAPELVESVRNSAASVAFELDGNYPNPFNSGTRIFFTLSRLSHIRLEICDLPGRRVRTFVQPSCSAGFHEIEWDGLDEGGRDAGSGIYIFVLSNGVQSISKKMIKLE
jgi:outer membrane protein assembly factor BamB